MKRFIVVALLALAACNSEASRVTPGDDGMSAPPAYRDEQTEWFLRSISEDGKTIAFVYQMSGVASECQREGTPRVEESDDAVTIHAMKQMTTDQNRACTEELAYIDETVELETPLGDRKLQGCEPTADLQDENKHCRDLERSRNAGVFEFSPPPQEAE